MLLIVIEGPTGVGKTELTLRLAEQLHTEIIGADSRQVYREIPIGTAAPTADEQERVVHHLVGCKSITENYNAGQYERDVLALIDELKQRHKTAILSGGSMMYVSAVLHGFDDIPAISPATRQQVQELYRQGGLVALQDELRRLDEDYTRIVDMQNPQRLMHAIEVCYESGTRYSTLRRGNQAKRDFEVLRIALIRDRQELYNRINRRVDEMISSGLLDEARRVLTPYLGSELPNSLNTVGYRELYRWLKGEWTLDYATEQIKQNSRHYAKRQLTWLRREKDINWININDYETTEDIVRSVFALVPSMYK